MLVPSAPPTITEDTTAIEAAWYGRVPYPTAWDWQKALVAERQANPDTPDRLLLLEHPPVYTLGRRGKAEHLLLSEVERQEAGIAVEWVDRGGDITYHGPGQLVGYPILNLKRLQGTNRPDLHRYLRDIEETLIRTLAHFGLRGWRYPGYTGVWVDDASGPLKIAAIGIKVSTRGVSSHGFALNVAPNLDHFAGIVPCGITAHGVTSMVAQGNRPVAVTDLIAPLTTAFAAVFNRPIAFVTPPETAYNDMIPTSSRSLIRSIG